MGCNMTFIIIMRYLYYSSWVENTFKTRLNVKICGNNHLSHGIKIIPQLEYFLRGFNLKSVDVINYSMGKH